MGRTSKPLVIGVTEPDLLEHPKLVELAAKGHTVFALDDECDVVLGRRAWYMDTAHLDRYLDMALAAARKAAYPRKEQSHA